MRFQLDALITAVQFLTRVPLPGGMNRPDADQRLLRASVIYYPLVGAGIGLFSGLSLLVALKIWPPLVAVALALTAEALLTGAFHEDAVADCCDAFGGGWTRDEVLRILKDSRVGSFGALGLMLAVSLRGVSLASLSEAVLLEAVVASATLGRFSILPLMATLAPVPNRDGLAKDVGEQIGLGEVLLGGLFTLPGLIPLFWGWPWQGLAAVAGLFLAVVLWRWYLQRRLGGLTGDCLGALCYAVQVLTLLVVLG